MSMTFALIGNQNSGKTTLFNQLTGSNQHVGNFPGVTVEKKEGIIRKRKNARVVDLPGIYSLSPYTADEVVTRDFLIKDKPDGIINILDATNIERNLYLTLQLMELNIPMILALNMMDEVVACGNSIDTKRLEAELGVDVVPISASKNEGVSELIDRAIKMVERNSYPKKLDFCTGEVHKATHSIAHLVEEKAKSIGVPARFAATKVVEGDKPMIRELSLSKNELDIVDHIISDMEKALGTDRESALADMRYTYITNLCSHVVHKKCETREQLLSAIIDSILTHKFFAIPIFLGIMSLIFWLTFGVFGSFLSDTFTFLIDGITSYVDSALTSLGVSAPIHSLIIDGIFAGVGSVLSFLPTILVLFFFLSMLEDSGYMARVAFVMDKLLRKIGLSGRSFVPMLIGFGCSVPAIMATRTLPSERDRKMTIILVPFMSCSAKLPIYAVFTAAFFQENQALVMIILYVLGMAMAILSGLLLKSTLFRGNPVPFVMELPSYRLPTLKSTALYISDKAKDFISRAFTVIFIATIAIWLLQSFDFGLNMVENSTDSMLAAIGKFMSPLFLPLGFGDWKASTALITGLAAKEAVVSTFAVLTGSGEAGTLLPMLSTMFTPLAAFSFLCFTLLYMPCIAAFAAMRREFGSLKGALLTVIYQTSVAWGVAFIVFNVGMLLGF